MDTKFGTHRLRIVRYFTLIKLLLHCYDPWTGYFVSLTCKTSLLNVMVTKERFLALYFSLFYFFFSVVREVVWCSNRETWRCPGQQSDIHDFIPVGIPPGPR